jgi:hypothetical protein
MNDHPFYLGQYAPFASIIPAGSATVKGSLKKIFQKPKIRLTDSEKLIAYKQGSTGICHESKQTT